MTSARSSAWTLVFFLISSVLLASCGGSSSEGNNNTSRQPETVAPDLPEPEPEPEPESEPELHPIVINKRFELGIREEIQLTFDGPIKPASLKLEGLLAELAARPEWSDGNQKVTLQPFDGAWESGRHTLLGTLETAAGVPVRLEFEVDIRLVFENFQEASTVIGQADFESWEWNEDPAINTLSAPFGIPTLIDGRLWIPELGNNRLLGFDGIPSSNQPDASWVVGQPGFNSWDYGTSATKFWTPLMGLEHEGYFYLLEQGNSRVSIFDHAPPVQVSFVIGQEGLSTRNRACSASGLAEPMGMLIVDNKLLVADSENNRVLVWNAVPKSGSHAPDIVLGQATMNSCARNDDDQDGSWDRQPSARTLHYPSGIWSDGKRLVIADAENNRVLIWNSFPSSSFTPADVVLGQPDFSSRRSNRRTADGLYFPYGLWSNGLQLFVADLENRRVLIWDEFPTENAQPADKVLGQPDLDTAEFHDQPSARTFPVPGGILAHRDKLLVLDTLLDRALIFEGY